MSPRRTAEDAAATRQSLLDIGRAMFTEQGFAATRTDELVRRAGVTRGALYHHFPSKEGLFAAVFEEIEREVSRRSRQAAATLAARDPLAALKRGLDAFLDACLEPDIARIMLLDAPSVLGWDAWREIDEQYAFGQTAAALEAAMAKAQLDRLPVEPLTHLLLGALTQAGMVVARADDPVEARDAMGATLARLLDGLRPTV
jgi:AcrR family transcriptional regulator